MGPDFDKTCFVIMPFGKEGAPEREQFDDTYENIIKKAVEESGLGLKCLRADEISRSGSIIDDIIRYAIKSKFVIADLTGRNPNVFYELGIRHSFSGRTILLAQSTSDLPFDVMPQRTIMYSKTTIAKAETAKKKLIDFLLEMNSLSSADDSPVLRQVSYLETNQEDAARPLPRRHEANHLILRKQSEPGSRQPVFSSDQRVEELSTFRQKVFAILDVMEIEKIPGCDEHPTFAVFQRPGFFQGGLPTRELLFFWKQFQFDPKSPDIYASFARQIKALAKSTSVTLVGVRKSEFIFPFCGRIKDESKFLANIETQFYKHKKAEKFGPILAIGSTLSTGSGWLGSISFDVWDIDDVELLLRQYSLTI